MDSVRYVLGVLTIIGVSSGLFFWFLIHPFARWWRRLGPAPTYLFVVLAVAALGTILFRMRGPLLGVDLGTNWLLVSFAIVLSAAMTLLEIQYWKYLSVSILVGLPEVVPAAQRTGKLLREGIYRVVRHPRYLSAGIGVISTALIVNYLGLYILLAVLFPLGYVMTVLEERELVERFGEEYRKYQREVPRLIPRWKKSG